MNTSRLIRNVLLYAKHFDGQKVVIKIDHNVCENILKNGLAKDIILIAETTNMLIYLAGIEPLGSVIDDMSLLYDFSAGFTEMGHGIIPILIKGADEDADVRAYELAIKIGADKLIFITTSDGIYNNEQALLHQLDIASAKNIADTSVIKGFMKHKLLLAIKACEEGIKRVHFISGHRHRENSLIKELFSTEGVGTMISANIYQNCRKANNDDIAEIIRILAQDSFYHRADIKYISTNINEFYVYAIDSDIHGCMKLVHSVETETLIIQTMAVQGILDDYDTTIKMAEAAISEAKNLCCKQLSVDIKQCPTWMIMDPAFYRLGFEQTPDTKIWSINL